MELYTRQIRAVTGNGTQSLKIIATPGKRVHSFQLTATFAAAATLANQMTAITELRVKVGTVVKWRLSGILLRDWCLLRGVTFDFNSASTVAQITVPLSPEWFLANVADALAWNPAKLGGDISLELSTTENVTVVAFENVSDDLDAPSAGIITLETITPVGGSTQFYTGEELEIRGRLISASCYPDSGAVTQAGLYVGKDNVAAFEDLTAQQALEANERKGLTPSASGRTASIFDIVAVKDDMLSRAWNLEAWGKARIKLISAGFTGTVPILLARLENR